MKHRWKIYNLERIKSDGMVTEVTYACESELNQAGTREIKKIALTTGSASDSGFISYNNLSENNVLGWITGSIDTSSIESANSASIAIQINNLAAETTEEGTPW